MIDGNYLTVKLKEIETWKGIKILKETMYFLLDKIKDRDPKDLDRAVEEILWATNDKFTPMLLKQAIDRFSNNRREQEWQQTKYQEREHASRFFDERSWDGKCTREVCRGCSHLNGCKVRGREWIKNINSVLKQGGGQEQAKEVIRFMNHDFMGGIK